MVVVILDVVFKEGLSGDVFSSFSVFEFVVGIFDDKLDVDYIKRYLGDLILLQESCFIRFCQWFQEIYKGKILKDEYIFWFFCVWDFNIDKVREIMCQFLMWRKQYQVDYIFEIWIFFQVFQDYYVGGWYYYDKDGWFFYVFRLGQMDIKGLVRVFGEEVLLRYVFFINEEGLR